MIKILKFLLPINRFTITGILMLIFGFLLVPFLIGIPIVMIGAVLIPFGIFWHILNFSPQGRKIKESLSSILKIHKPTKKNIKP